MNRDEDLVTIHKYLTGQLSDADRQDFERRLAQEPELQAELTDVEQSLEFAGQYTPPKWDVEGALGAMPFAPVNELESPQSGAKKRPLRVWLQSAAAVLILVVAGFLAVSHFSDKNITYSDSGVLALEDGSSIYLKSEATISYPEEFDEAARVVELDGEAFFDIAREEKRSFEVKTDYASITVLGTSFVVSEDDENKVVEVYVTSGKVRVKPNGSEAYVDLTVGQSARYDVNSGELRRDKDGDMNDIAWYTKSLKWRNAGLQEVIDDLEETLAITFDTENVTTGLNCPYTASYKDVTMAKLPEILSSMEDVFGIRAMQMSEGKYSLSGGECEQFDD